MIGRISDQEFEEAQGYSYSRLSKLAESPSAYRAYIAGDKKDTPAIALGAAVDLMLTDPESFDKEIYVMSAEKPSADTMLKFVEVYHQTGSEQTAYEASQYKISLDRVLKKFDEEGKHYYDALQAAKGKKILPVDDMFKVNQLVQQLRSNQFTAKYFTPSEEYQLYFQFPVIWEENIRTLTDNKLETKLFKGIIDIVVVDHKKKKIIPVDLKVGEDSFIRSFWMFKRYLQGSMYTHALLYTYDEEYEIEPLRFVYADSNLIYPPVVYRMTEKDVYTARTGYFYHEFDYCDDKVNLRSTDITRNKGYIQLAAELDWHVKMDLWDYSYDVYKNDGVIDINAFITRL